MAKEKEAKTMEFPLSVNFYDILLRKGFDAGTNVTLSDGFGKDNAEAEFLVMFSDNVGLRWRKPSSPPAVRHGRGEDCR